MKKFVQKRLNKKKTCAVKERKRERDAKHTHSCKQLLAHTRIHDAHNQREYIFAFIQVFYTNTKAITNTTTKLEPLSYRLGSKAFTREGRDRHSFFVFVLNIYLFHFLMLKETLCTLFSMYAFALALTPQLEWPAPIV